MNKNTMLIVGAAVLVAVIAIVSGDKFTPETKTSNQALDPINKNEMVENHHNHDQVDHHLHEAEVAVSSNAFSAQMNALGMVPLQNESGAVGYGVITDLGTDAVVVSTTHAGVLDSELQKDASDPVWHNHVVKLGEVALCGEDPGVIDITFESPGSIEVDNDQLVMVDVPASFDGTHSLDQSNLTFNYGTEVKGVVEFELSPKFSEQDELQAVCVTNIKEVPYNLI